MVGVGVIEGGRARGGSWRRGLGAIDRGPGEAQRGVQTLTGGHGDLEPMGDVAGPEQEEVLPGAGTPGAELVADGLDTDGEPAEANAAGARLQHGLRAARGAVNTDDVDSADDAGEGVAAEVGAVAPRPAEAARTRERRRVGALGQEGSIVDGAGRAQVLVGGDAGGGPEISRQQNDGVSASGYDGSLWHVAVRDGDVGATVGLGGCGGASDQEEAEEGERPESHVGIVLTGGLCTGCLLAPGCQDRVRVTPI